jgi:hypothetical protein
MDSFEKQASEKYTINIDFSNLLATSEVISSYTVFVYHSNTDVTSIIIDAHTNTTTSVSIRLKGGTENTNYKITTKIVTNSNNEFEKDIQMEVREI